MADGFDRIRSSSRVLHSTVHRPAKAPPIEWPVKMSSCSGAISRYGARSSNKASARNRKPACAVTSGTFSSLIKVSTLSQLLGNACASTGIGTGLAHNTLLTRRTLSPALRFVSPRRRRRGSLSTVCVYPIGRWRRGWLSSLATPRRWRRGSLQGFYGVLTLDEAVDAKLSLYAVAAKETPAPHPCRRTRRSL